MVNQNKRMEYLRPKNQKETLHLMKRWKGKVRLIAGGTNVIPDLRSRAIRPEVLIDISHLKNLSYIREERGRIRIGGRTTLSELSSSGIIKQYGPALFDAANQIGNPLVRNRATIAGNLADGSPAADTAVPLLVLEAKVSTVRSDGKMRQIAIDQFFVGPNRTVLNKDEIIKEITFTKPDSKAKMTYAKLGLRNSMAISIVSVAVLLEIRGQRCSRARMGLGAVAPTPIRAYRTEELLLNRKVTEELIDSCCERIKEEINPITDIRASADYRRAMTSVLLKRLIRKNIEG
ncbi:MAG: xanthine dehydrogenase family protein subunit M [Thermodesulfobacteriota bacterium]|nr:xanthine dehydrogenase family protein subunit M [Thermodesulfobacteriota bacterium]